MKRAPWTAPTASPAWLTSDEHKAAKTTAFDLQLNPANPGMTLHKLDRAGINSFGRYGSVTTSVACDNQVVPLQERIEPVADNADLEEVDDTEKDRKPEPYGFWRTLVIVLSGHLGVRPSSKRKEDFARANGVYVFAVAVLYFVLVITALIVLVNFIAR